MIRSMTGFGDASALVDGVQFGVEVRSVNNKFFKAILRTPERLSVLEPALETHLRRRIARGTVTLTVSCTEVGEKAAHEINAEALSSYMRQLAKVEGVNPAQIDPAHLLSIPGVLSQPSGDQEWVASARRALEPLIDEAVEHLLAMRTREGQALRDDLAMHHALIIERLDRITELAPGVAAEYQRRLKSRLESLLAEFDVRAEPSDLIREVAVYAEKTDVAEEIARLGEHLRHFTELLDSDDERPIGRTMDFLSQELLREANTIASKSPDAEISRLIVEVKGAIDRIKEQVQNVE